MGQNLFCAVTTYLLYLVVGCDDGKNELLKDIVKELSGGPIQTILRRRNSHV